MRVELQTNLELLSRLVYCFIGKAIMKPFKYIMELSKFILDFYVQFSLNFLDFLVYYFELSIHVIVPRCFNYRGFVV